MTYRVAGHQEAHPSPSCEDLRRKFETAVCELHQADLAAEKRLKHHAPIVPRRRILGISQADAEKLAMSEAAKALAALWKV